MRKILEWIYRILHPSHKIGRCGAVVWETKEGSKCAECGKTIK
jgi:hypothetical protein